MLILDEVEKAGILWTRIKEYKGWMKEIGFADVEKILDWLINTWPRDTHLNTLGF